MNLLPRYYFQPKIFACALNSLIRAKFIRGSICLSHMSFFREQLLSDAHEIKHDCERQRKLT